MNEWGPLERPTRVLGTGSHEQNRSVDSVVSYTVREWKEIIGRNGESVRVQEFKVDEIHPRRKKSECNGLSPEVWGKV